MVKNCIIIALLMAFAPGLNAMDFFIADAGYFDLSMKTYNSSILAYEQFNSINGSTASIHVINHAEAFSLTYFAGDVVGPDMMFFYLRGSYTPFFGERNIFYNYGGPMLSMKDEFYHLYFAPGLRYYFGKSSKSFTAIPFIGLDIGYVYCTAETKIKTFYYDGSDMWTDRYTSVSSLFGGSIEAGCGFNFNEMSGIEIKAGYRLQKGTLGKLKSSGSNLNPNSRDQIIFNNDYSYDIDASGFFISAGITIYAPEKNAN